MKTSESFIACFPYTAVASLLPGESVIFAQDRESDWYTIEKTASGNGYIVTRDDGASGDFTYFATAREVRSFVIGEEPCAPLVAFN